MGVDRRDEVKTMKELRVELPERLAREMAALVEAGWFGSEAELARVALAEFVRLHRFELQEQFQRDDIAWALQQRRGDP